MKNQKPTSLGIDHLKQLVKFIILAVQKGTTIDEDKNGRISLVEAFSILTSLGFKFPAVYNAFPEAIREWKDLTQEEIDELVQWFSEEFDLPGVEHGRIEALVKECVQAIVDNYNHVQRIKEILG